MNVQDELAAEGVDVRQIAGEGGPILVADFGEVTESFVDVVGDTAIVVVDEDQYELELTADAQAFITNGVLTIEVNE